MVFATPLPIWMIFLHLSMTHGTSRSTQYILYFSLGIIWFLLALWAFSNQELIFGPVFETTPWMQWLGVGIVLLGLLIDALVIRVLGWRKLIFFTELRGDAGNEQLIISGIYKHARHPRYVEYPLIAIGAALVTGYWTLIGYAIYIFLGLWLVTYFEEQELVHRFGDPYHDYKKRVPRFFIKI